jgi:hypothetical protein
MHVLMGVPIATVAWRVREAVGHAGRYILIRPAAQPASIECLSVDLGWAVGALGSAGGIGMIADHRLLEFAGMVE